MCSNKIRALTVHQTQEKLKENLRKSLEFYIFFESFI